MTGKKLGFGGFNEIPLDLYKITQYRGCGPETSTKQMPNRRKKAKEQFKKANEQEVPNGDIEEFNNQLIEKIIKKTFEFLSEYNIMKIESPKMSLPFCKIDKEMINEDKSDSKNYKNVAVEYELIKKEYALNNINHLVWMKFAKCQECGRKYLGVVAASKDINFSPDLNSDDLIKELGLVWDESFVLIFPLPRITDGIRNDIEVGIGNYLIMDTVEYAKTGDIIEGDIQILDFYSHRFQRS